MLVVAADPIRVRHQSVHWEPVGSAALEDAAASERRRSQRGRRWVVAVVAEPAATALAAAE